MDPSIHMAAMTTAPSELSRAIEAFRRDHALGFVQQLSGQAVSPSRAQRHLGSDQALEQLSQLVSSGQIGTAEHSAIAAHMARAVLEEALSQARAQQLKWPSSELTVEAERRTVRAYVAEWLALEVAPKRLRIAHQVAGALAAPTTALARARSRADESAQAWIRKIAAPRHPDAGPEAGSAALAEELLRDTEDVTRAAVQFACAKAGVASQEGLEVLWALQAHRYQNLFSPDGRTRRIGNDWEALGLRRTLSSHARSAPTHPGVFPVSHTLVAASPRDVRVVLSSLSYGLLSELSAAQAVGRAVGLVHASPALPFALRHAPAATVARSLGEIGLCMFLLPEFLRRVRDLSRRESEDVARLSAAYVLIDARLSAAAVLARGLGGEGWTERAASLANRALTSVLPTSLGAHLVTRVSPGAPLRAKAHAWAISLSLRERFDEDWFRNPRAGEPLRGAAARAGDFSVEGFAEELSAQRKQGPSLLSALF